MLSKSSGHESRVNILKLAAILVILSATVYAIRQWWIGPYRELIHEHGPLEFLHMGILFVSALWFGDAYKRGAGAVKVAGGALGMLAFAAFFRELDVKSLGGPEWFQYLTAHGLQEVLLIVMTLPIFIYLYLQRRHFWDLVDLALRWRSWPLFLAGALTVISVYLDARVVTNDVMRFWEELIETYGYGFMALAAWRHHQLIDDQVTNSQPSSHQS